MAQQYLLMKCIEDIKNIIKGNEQIFQFDVLFKNKKDFIEGINNFLNAVSFDNLKSNFKDFSELISTFQNWIDRMKNIKEKINILINQYENFRDLDNFNEIFKQINERVIFGGFEEFCDKKIKTNAYDSCGKKR